MSGTSEAGETVAGGPVAALLRARSIAVVGASGKEDSFGHNVVTHLVDTGYPGRLYPINPRYETIAGLACFGDIAALPERTRSVRRHCIRRGAGGRCCCRRARSGPFSRFLWPAFC